MLVCEKRNLGFIHIPATAGTTLESYLLSLGFQYNKPSNNEVSMLQRHNKAFEVTHVDVKKFCIVRNPYNREISMYEHVKRNIDLYRKHIPDTIRVNNFDSWIRSKYLDSDCPNHHMVDKNDSMLSYITVNGEIVCDIIRYEYLNEENNEFAKNNNLPLDVFKHTRLNSNKKTHMYWSKALINIAAPYYREDCDKLVYW